MAQKIRDAGVGRLRSVRNALHEPDGADVMILRPTLAAALCAVLSFPAQAQTDKLLAFLDQNGDGAISRAEFIALRQQIFARIDADSSGTLSQLEVTAAQEAAAERRRQSRDLWSQDTDGDGQLTLAEFTAQTPGFDRADRDGDGVLSTDEIDRARRLLGTLSGRD